MPVSSLAPIFIPTYGRDCVKTLESIPEMLSSVILVVTREDVNKFGRRFNYLPLKEQGRGVARVRDALVMYCAARNYPVCCMLDDDLRFRTGTWVDGKKRFSTTKGLVRYFNKCFRRAAQHTVAMCSFSQEYFNRYEDEWIRDKDNASTYFVNVDNYVAGKCTFNIDILEDRFFCLTAIESGLDLWCNSYVSSTKIGKRDLGGENAVGNRGTRHAEIVKKLAKLYPRFVTIRKSTNSKYIQNYGTDIQGRYQYARMRKAVERGEDVRQ